MPQWKKKGFLFNVSGEQPWMQMNASNPVAIPLDDKNCRFFFSSRDKDNRAHIASVDIQLFPEVKILSVSKDITIGPGEVGLFDDSGTSLSCIMKDQGTMYMYYLGWNLGVTVPWRNSIGLATSSDGREFKKVSLAPTLDRNHKDPYSISYPFVMKDDGLWKMWYGSNLRWGAEQKDMDHIIKYAYSEDGKNWKPTGEISINIEKPNEYAFSRPYVIKRDGLYRMWYSFRGESYRIGYAESKDGIHFTRKDTQSGITVSAEGWDSEMVCYPHIFEMAGRWYMVYNGNRYGKTGFGWAELAEW